MEKNVKIGILLETYGKLLTEKQYNLLDYYYNNDYSLSEIAENLGITRQAVRTILVKSKKKLYEYEEKLRFLEKEKRIKTLIQKIELVQKEEERKKYLKQIKENLIY